MLEKQLNIVIKDFLGQPLTPAVLRSIRESLRFKIHSIFTSSKNYNLSPEGVTWLTDQYFKSIQISGDQLISDNVVINEYTLPELLASDIKLLLDLYGDTKLGLELRTEAERRKNVS